MDQFHDGNARSDAELAAFEALSRPPDPSQRPEERKELEDAYRQAISLVRSLARALGRPCPIATREERRERVVTPPR